MAIEREPVEVTVEIDGDGLVAGVLRVHDRRGQSATFAYSEGYLRDPRAYPLDPRSSWGLPATRHRPEQRASMPSPMALPTGGGGV
ncbi:MAG: hypothetical protein ACYCYK_09770 [Candidatus Dormibacteria bacterium]